MSFKELLKEKENSNDVDNENLVMDKVDQTDNDDSGNGELSEKKKEKPEEVLRKANFKIKMVTPTAFGTQIDLARAYDEADIKDVLKDFTIKIKGKSIFIVE